MESTKVVPSFQSFLKLRVRKPLRMGFSSKNKLKWGLACYRLLYMFGKIFLWGVMFDILYNVLAQENMKNLENFYSQSSETNINLL